MWSIASMRLRVHFEVPHYSSTAYLSPLKFYSFFFISSKRVWVHPMSSAKETSSWARFAVSFLPRISRPQRFLISHGPFRLSLANLLKYHSQFVPKRFAFPTWPCHSCDLTQIRPNRWFDFLQIFFASLFCNLTKCDRAQMRVLSSEFI